MSQKEFDKTYSVYVLYRRGATKAECDNAFSLWLKLVKKYKFSETQFSNAYARQYSTSSSTNSARENESKNSRKYEETTSSWSSSQKDDFYKKTYGFYDEGFKGNNNYSKRKEQQQKQEQAHTWATQAQYSYILAICHAFGLEQPPRFITYDQARQFLNHWATVYENFIKYKNSFHQKFGHEWYK
jgi:hypothetical protein